MGSADGLLVGLALLAGLTLGVPGVALTGLVTVALQGIARRLDVFRLVLAVMIALVGAARAGNVTNPNAPPGVAGSTAAIGLVISMPVSRGDGQQFLLRTARVQRDKTWRDVETVVSVATRDSRVNVGDRVWIAWQVELASDMEPGYGGYIRAQGAVASAHVFVTRVEATGTSWQRWFVQARANLGRSLQQAAPGDAGALLAGMVTGDDGQLDSRTRDEFRVTQTSHITAVSGSNLAMVAGLWATLGASGWLRRRWWYQALVVGTIGGYAVLVGLEPPAVRAAIVTLLAVLSIRFGRRPDPLTLLVVTAATMAMFDPGVTASLGFQLSVVASGALVACLPNHELRIASWLVYSVLAVLSAELATLPLIVGTFGMWSPVSLLANVLIAPLVPVATYAGAIAAMAGIAWEPLGNIIGWLAAWPAEGILLVVHRCALVAAPLPVSGAGRGGLAVISALAVAMLATISPEARRFAADVRHVWPATPATVALAAGSCAAGIVFVVTALFALT